MYKEEPAGSLVYHNESGDLYLEDVNQHMVVLLKVTTSMAKVTIDNIQVGDTEVSLSDDHEILRQFFWIALPTASSGAVCDID